MNEDYEYKGFDVCNTTKKEKIRNEYFNPYGCNIYSTSRQSIDYEYNVTHTNQDNNIK